MVDLKITLPEGFLDEEERCGYTVTHKMKEVWAVELDLLAEFQRVCKKYGLAYSGSGGTMLGAVRHKGFIPWDDDIDIDMPRKDYNKLCEIAEKEFRGPYFFQTEFTDRGSMRGHAQLRRSDTTAILTDEKKMFSFNQGIFIDIFPQDNIPDSPSELDKYIHNVIKYKNISGRMYRFSNFRIALDKKGKYRLFKIILNPVFRLFHFLKMDTFFYRKMEYEAQKYCEEDTKKVACITFMPDKERIRYSSEYLKETISVPFEFTTIDISRIYDEILKQMYGDYMKFVVGGNQHGTVFFDTAKSYKNYI